MAEKENSIELLCIGNALVDVFASSEEDLFIRHGITQPVQHIKIEKLKELLSELSGFTTVSGGGAANVAKIAGLLGAKVSFTGATGNDEFGRLFEKSLAAAGVQLRLSLKPSPTGICLMLRNEAGKTCGETRIAASPSAAIELSENDINADELRQARVVVIDGFMLDKSALASHILRMAGRNGTTAAIDLSSPGIAREYAAEIADYAKRYPLILFMNEVEAEAFYDGLKPALPEPPSKKISEKITRIFSFFQDTNGKSGNPVFPIIVVKLGKGGALTFAEGKIIRSETKAVTPVDTTGAGDAFCAGFLAAWIKNKTLSECASLGNMAAGIVLDAEGSQADEKTLKTLITLLES
jgi:sugar/nucleoside kinase (ribokinase family)